MSETISMEYLANLSARLAKAEAQVQAVREQIAYERYSDPGEDAYCLGYNDACDDVIGVLDGNNT